ncbi:type II toxin-antitoxin system VapB family antitoxin [Variovorax sp. J22R133]|uniref:type II toxin-antitoxin system VapB family antitoxin n=1 Tax=Variovorax brevis TaxID=3053503 RepID=UPI002578C607|nr:type II toxin-antitoxin system VapB family antitoxin [Variovorax sp. J22R133]MDM0115147.1 type II toxin-antitoxin system VapB family antitoxin [Variovorax sp. J22R133]
MSITLTIDDALFERAVEVADPGMSPSDLLREAVETFIRVQAGKRLAALGGTEPDLLEVPRRRPEAPTR